MIAIEGQVCYLNRRKLEFTSLRTSVKKTGAFHVIFVAEARETGAKTERERTNKDPRRFGY